MDTSHKLIPLPTKSQKTAFYVVVSIVSGMGIYFLAQGLSQLW
jgi:hypothetical protein